MQNNRSRLHSQPIFKRYKHYIANIGNKFRLVAKQQHLLYNFELLILNFEFILRIFAEIY